MTAELYTKENKKIGTVDLPERIFGVRWNSDLVHQAMLAQQNNARRPSAHAKSRSEVSGGGIKPWRQKGTGRSRHGSIRSPLWRHGGVTHGPNADRNPTSKLNKKMRQLAIFAVLSRRFKDNEIKFVDSLEGIEAKTKVLAAILKTLSGSRMGSLILPVSNPNIYRASRNIKGVKTLDARALNVYDLLKYKQIIIEKGALDLMDKHYNGGK